MHRDTKLGLALGILLVGIVGAFFFRNETARRDEPPALADPRALDAEIAEKPVAPYLMAPEFGGEPDDAIETSPVSTVRDDRAWEMPEFLRNDSGELPPGREDTLPGPPDPIIVKRNDIADAAAIPIPDHNRAWEVSQTSLAHGGVQLLPPLTDTIEYRVRPGDTLSGLAATHLGSTARYREIFEMNRDVLRSPDDLRAGMTIRLPAPGPAAGDTPARNASTQSDASQAATEDPANDVPDDAPPETESDDKPHMFSPVRRPPLSRRSAARPPADEPIKGLTQSPPDTP